MISRVHWLLMTAVLFVESIVTTWIVVRLPERVPLHWNLAGEVDRYGSPWEFVYIGPPTTLLVAGLLLGLPLIPSVGQSLARSGPIYGRMAVTIVAAIAAIHLAVLFPIARAELPQGDGPHSLVTADQVVSPILVLAGILFMLLGNWMGKVRRNPVMGIRTKWTLSDDVIWERTQRVGGRMFAGLGLIVTLAAIFCPFWVTLVILGVGTLAFCAFSHIYSWRLARASQPPASG